MLNNIIGWNFLKCGYMFINFHLCFCSWFKFQFWVIIFPHASCMTVYFLKFLILKILTENYQKMRILLVLYKWKTKIMTLKLFERLEQRFFTKWTESIEIKIWLPRICQFFQLLSFFISIVLVMCSRFLICGLKIIWRFNLF